VCSTREILTTRLLCALHVDDLLVSADDHSQLDHLLVLLQSEFKEVKVKSEDVNSYLGMRLRQTDDAIEVDMIAYVEECIAWSKVTGSAITPAEADLFEIDDKLDPVDEAQREDFHTGVAKLLYLAKRCRPDILLYYYLLLVFPCYAFILRRQCVLLLLILEIESSFNYF
jgi:hypothetical protein